MRNIEDLIQCEENSIIVRDNIVVNNNAYFIGTFIYVGWIFDNKMILIFYLVFEVIIILHWITNHWKCCLTQYENKVCNFDKKEKYDYVFKIMNNKTAIILALTIKAIILCYVIYKLFFKKKDKKYSFF